MKGIEQSILDFVIVCEDIFACLSSMKIDDNNSLERHIIRKGNSMVRKSDHKLIVCKFDTGIFSKKSDIITGKDKIQHFSTLGTKKVGANSKSSLQTPSYQTVSKVEYLKKKPGFGLRNLQI